MKDTDTSSELASRNQEIGTIGGAFGAGDVSLAGYLPTAEIEPLPGDPGAADKLATLAEPTAAAAMPLDFWASDDPQNFAAASPSAGIDDGAAFHHAAIVTEPRPEVEPHQVHSHPAPSHPVGYIETADEDRQAPGDSWHSALSGTDMGAPQDTFVLDHAATTAVGYNAAGFGNTAMALGGSGGHSVSGISGNVSFGTTKGTGWESTYIDTLISGVKLDGGPIHYYLASAPDSSNFYTDDFGRPFTLYNWSASDQTAVAQMFQLYENVTNLDFVQVSSYDQADIVWWQANSTFFNWYFGDTGFIGFNEFPDPTDGTILPLFGVFDTTYMHKAPVVQGADGFQTLMHELGHGLGLAHPHDGYNGNEVFPGLDTNDPNVAWDTGTYGLNQNIWTEMSYNRGWDQAPWGYNYGGNGTPMALDIAALQDMYGKNTTFNAGDNTYLLPTANVSGTFWSAIWDVGGTDTIDGSKATGTVFINLNDAELNGEHAGGYVSWQKATGGGFTIANSVVIENAVGGSGADTLTGNEADNSLTGNGGNDTLDGGTGADKMTGGLGNDTYFVDDVDTVLTEAAKGGTDTVKSHFSVDLNNGIYAGQEIENIVLLSGATSATGNALNNVIDDDDNGHTISGGDGNDTLNGNGGDDTLNGENGNDILNGGDGNDVLDGGLDADTMTGGKGNDTYIVDNVGDKVLESLTNPTGGSADEVQSAINFSLAALANIDNLTLTDGALTGTGNALVNTLTGNDNANTLDGGTGIDFFIGGKGDDTYILDNTNEANATHVAEKAGEGSDTVKTGAFLIAGPIANVENYSYTGALVWTFDASSHGNENNTLSGGTGNDNLKGGDGADKLLGNGGNDTLNGGLGVDDLQGGLGNDTYEIDATVDSITEAKGGGIDLIKGSVSIDLTAGGFAGQEIENVTLLDTFGNLGIIGNELNNLLTGNDGKNTIAGGAGNDTINGNGNDDTLSGGAGNDSINGGDGNDALEGNAGADKLDGGDGSDQMNATSGADGAADSMIGGKGDDTYKVWEALDTVIETITNGLGGGIDTVNSDITFSLAALANVDNVSLFGPTQFENLNATGNALTNKFDGNSGDNVFDGGAGNDFFSGHAGNDTFILDNVDEDNSTNVVEAKDEGIDTVKTAVLAIANAIDNVENYVFTGAGKWTFTGNDLDNAITGGGGDDTLNGGKGNDTLDGGAGNDAMAGGEGNDTYIVGNVKDSVTENIGEGDHDKVVSGLSINLATDVGLAGQDIEDLTLTGTAAKGTGNALANIIVGNDAANTLDGLGGADRLVGGKGSDIYFLDNAGDAVFELKGEGTDTINTKVDIDLALDPDFAGQEIENLTAITGSGNLTLTGNALNNIIIGAGGNDILLGGDGNDTLTGGDGSDTLDGGKGNDTMTGGAGNDGYTVDSIGDKVVESIAGAAGGTKDAVNSSITFSLAALVNVEDLYLAAGAGNINATGNAAANTLVGNENDNVLDGGGGIDIFIGGDGNDTYVIDDKTELLLDPNIFDSSSFGINDSSGSDTIKTALLLKVADIDTSLLGVIENFTYTGSAAWTFDLSTAIGLDHKLIGGTGNDTLTGADKNNWLDGGAGADKLQSDNGDDTFVVDNLGDKILDGGGNDTLLINRSINLTTAINLGADGQFIGVIENVTLTGIAALNATGTSGVNVLTGNDGANTLDGLGGADILAGGKGSDIYFLDDAGDKVIEDAKGGTDTINTKVDIDLALDPDFAGQEIENLTAITGSGNLTLTGNALNNIIIGAGGNDILLGGDGNDTLTGGDGSDTLDGGKGNDTMTGGAGNDGYTVDSIGDKVVESIAGAAGGTKDAVNSSITFSLAALVNVEDLYLAAGAGNINATGNAAVNTLVGNDGDNVLDGGAGIDIFIGGDGNDTYVIDDKAELKLDPNLMDQNSFGINDSSGSDTIKTALLLKVADIDTSLLGVIENFTYTGSAAWTFDLSTAVGLDHKLIGGTGNDTLTGADKNNWLDGGAGADKLQSDNGDDTFVVDNLGDKILDGGGNDTLLINRSINLTTAINLGADGQFIGVIENVTLTGTAALNATGTSGVNVLTGNDGANKLDGLGGADILAGGKGNDIYVLYGAGEDIVENAKGGIDTIQSNFNIDLSAGNFVGDEIENVSMIDPTKSGVQFTGNALANALTGGNGDDTLDGGAGNDTLTGGKGDDTYVVDSLGDKVVESLTNATGGFNDLVKSSISFSIAALANIDNLTLTGGANIDGTGNAAVNFLTGNNADNILNGGAGIDFFNGHDGNDTYVIDNLAELSNITDSSGSDTVKTVLLLTGGNIASIAGFIENYTYTGSAAWTFDLSAQTGVDHHLTGGGGIDTLTGSDGNDVLDGGLGADKLFGGAGNDTYVVDNLLDTVDEQGNTDANDSVVINRSVNLQTDFLGTIENATLTGLTALNATGNSAANHLTGNDGNNILSALAGADFITGGKGDDTLSGGANADTFDYNALTDRGTGKEVITDFNVAGGDKLDVHDLLTGLGYGGVDPFADGFLNFAADGKGNTIIQVDADGGGNGYVTLVTLQGTILNETDAANLVL